VLDKNNNEYLDMTEFIEGLSTLFSDSTDKIEKFIFQLYDFDKDGLISREDVRVVLSYIPLNVRSKVSSEFNLKFEKYN
jgi:Ca2+-binding EF-hand superfamily protein